MYRKAFFLATVLAVLSARGWALEIGADLSIGNFNFERDRAPAETDFKPCYLPVEYAVWGRHKIDAASGISFGVSSDKILRNMIHGIFSYSGDYYTLSVGPFFGVFNTDETPVNPGVTASVKFQIPGKVFVVLETARSLALANIFSGGGLSPDVEDTGDYIQEDNRIALGLYVRNTILSFSIRSRLFSSGDADYGVVTDSMTDYSVVTDIFRKNSPFKPMISFTYRSLSKRFEDAVPATRHTAGSLILGTRVDFTVRRHLSAYVGLDSGFYTFGLDDLVGEFGSTDYFFTGSAGVRLDLDTLR